MVPFVEAGGEPLRATLLGPRGRRPTAEPCDVEAALEEQAAPKEAARVSRGVLKVAAVCLVGYVCFIVILLPLSFPSSWDDTDEDALVNAGRYSPSNWTHIMSVNGRHARRGEGEAGMLCTAYRLPRSQQTLRQLDPSGGTRDLRRMLVYACESMPEADLLNEDEGSNPVWRCDNAAPGGAASFCGDGKYELIWTWSPGAPGMSFGHDRAFSLESRAKDNYLVLQTHINPDSTLAEANARLEITFDNVVPRKYLSLYPIAAGSEGRGPSGEECCVSGAKQLEVYGYYFGGGPAISRASLLVDGKEILSGVRGSPSFERFERPTPMSAMVPTGAPWQACCSQDASAPGGAPSGGARCSETCEAMLLLASEQRGGGSCWGKQWRHANTPRELERNVTSASRPLQAIQRGPVGPNPANQVGGLRLGIGAESHILYIFHRADRGMTPMPPFKPILKPGGSEEEYSKTTEAATIVAWDLKKRRQVRSFGNGLFHLPHGMTVDLENNFWVTDVASHQVHKLNHAGRVLMTLGTKFKEGSGKHNFCHPTQVAVASDGRVFVADGYCNTRVVEFTAQGKFVREYLIPTGDAGGQTEGTSQYSHVIHNVLYDDCKDQLWVTDREDAKVYVYSASNASVTNVIDLSEWGFVYSIARDEFGNIHALTFRRKDRWPGDDGGNVYLVPMVNFAHDSRDLRGAELEGMEFPHEFEVSYDYTANTLVLYVGETSFSAEGRITEFTVAL